MWILLEINVIVRLSNEIGCMKIKEMAMLRNKLLSHGSHKLKKLRFQKFKFDLFLFHEIELVIDNCVHWCHKTL